MGLLLGNEGLWSCPSRQGSPSVLGLRWWSRVLAGLWVLANCLKSQLLSGGGALVRAPGLWPGAFHLSSSSCL